MQENVVANQNKEAGQVMSYYSMRFMLNVQFVDIVRNTKELPLKRP